MTIERKVQVIETAERKKDVKTLAKEELSAMFAEFLEEKGIKCRTDHASFGFTRGTLLVEMEDTDVQVKLITPKAGLDRYAEIQVHPVAEEEAATEPDNND